MGTIIATDPAPSAWVRRRWARAFECAAGTVPSAGRRGQHPGLLSQHPGELLPRAAPSGVAQPAAAPGHHDAQKPVATAGVVVAAGGPERAQLPPADRRPDDGATSR